MADDFLAQFGVTDEQLETGPAGLRDALKKAQKVIKDERERANGYQQRLRERDLETALKGYHPGVKDFIPSDVDDVSEWLEKHGQAFARVDAEPDEEEQPTPAQRQALQEVEDDLIIDPDGYLPSEQRAAVTNAVIGIQRAQGTQAAAGARSEVPPDIQALQKYAQDRNPRAILQHMEALNRAQQQG